MRRERVADAMARSATAGPRRAPISGIIGSFPTYISLVALCLLVAWGEARLGGFIMGRFRVPADGGLFGGLGYCLFPFVAIPSAISLVLGARIAMAAGGTAALVVWLACGFEPGTLLCALGGILVVSRLSPHVRRAADFAILVLHVFAIQTALSLGAMLLCHHAGVHYDPVWIAMQFATLLLLDIASIPATLWLLLPLAERLSGRTSAYTLATFASLEHPLLMRLSREAPGTYGHSMIVADIASEAAGAIGADPLLARIGGYYHDIGKLSNPTFFMENQSSLGNPHDRLPPSISAMIIANHVKDGAIMARESHLPGLIVRIIATHHGKSEMKWFRLKAASAGDASLAESGMFRYNGDLPRSREETIVSLADSVEAASRTLRDPDAGAIARLVDGIVADRFADGQLSESEIGFGDLELVKRSMVLTLVHRLHARMAYPNEK